MKTIQLTFATLTALLLLLATDARAGTYYWDANSTTAGFGTASGTWGTSAFWSTDNTGVAAPANTTITTSDGVNFGYTTTGLATGAVTGPATAQGFSTMTFASGSGAITLSGGTLNLAASATVTVDNTSNYVSSVLQGSGSALTKAGTGTLTLAGDNTYTGTTTVSAGTLNYKGSLTGGGSIVAGSTSLPILNIASSGTVAVTDLTLGSTASSSAKGTLNLSSGNLNLTGTLYVGRAGPGYFTQTGGTYTNNSANVIYMGNETTSGSPATFMNITGGIFSHPNKELGIGIRQTATFTNGGGTVILGQMQFGRNVSGLSAYTVSATLNGGTTTVGAIANKANSSTKPTANFYFNGGTLKASGDSATFMTGLNNAYVQAGGAYIDDGGYAITIGQALLTDPVSTGGGLTKSGSGKVTLSGANTYTGNTTISAGALLLGSGGSIGASATTVSSTATLGSATTSTTTIGAATTYSSGALASFTATGGASTSVGKISVTGNLNLNANAITVNVFGSALAAGTYRLLDCTGTLANTGTFGTPTISGTALASGYTASISVTTGSAGHVDLVVNATPSFTGLAATPPSIIYGATSVSLSGTLSSTPGPTTVYAANGDTVTATINGHAVSGTVSGSSGAFTINYNDASLQTDGPGSYTITYAYAGNSPAYLNAAANDTSTSLTINPQTSVATTTDLAASPNPSLVTSNVIFTATVKTNGVTAGNATNTMVFKDGVTALSTNTVSGGMATFSTSALVFGLHSITATYSGDANYNLSVSATVTQIVQTATTTILTASPNPSVLSSNVTFVATVQTNGATSLLAGGSVVFKSGGTPFGTNTLVGGAVTNISSALPAGTNFITAEYQGDGYCLPSTNSPALAQFVNTPPTVEITSPTNGSTFIMPGSVTLTATVGDTDGSVTSVQYFAGATSLGIVSNAPYTLTVAYTKDGVITYTAQATDNLGASTVSAPVTITNVLHLSATTIDNGDFETGANVSPGGFVDAVPSWSEYGTSTIGSAKGGFWNNYTNNLSVTYPAAATNTYPAFFGWGCGSLITKNNSETAGMYQSLGTVAAGDVGKTFSLSASFSGRLRPSAGSANMTVGFATGTSSSGRGTVIGTASTNLISCPASSTVTNLVGWVTNMATYTPASGDVGTTIYAFVDMAQVSGTAGEQKQWLVDNVTLLIQTPTTTALASSLNPSPYGSTVTFTATVQTNGATAGDATSNMVFKVDGTAVATNAISGGVATYTTAGLPTGSYAVTAEYSGDAIYLSSTNSPALSQAVNKATFLTATAPVAGAITYGQTLASSMVTGATFTNAAGVTVTMASTNFVSPGIVADAGSTNVEVYFVPSDVVNYNNVTNQVSVTVNQAPLGITANSTNKIYDGVAFTGGNGVTYSGFVNGETAGVLGGSLSYVGTAQGATNAGSYSLVPYGLTSVNYAITYTNGTLTIGQASTFVGAFSTKNPSGYTDNVSYIATLPADATGNVVFSSTNGAFSTNAVSGTNTSSLSINTLPRGTNVITVTYGGDGNYLSSTTSIEQIVTNHPPVAALMTVSRPAGMILKVALSDIATNWSDADADGISLTNINLTTTNGTTLIPLNVMTNLNGSYVTTNVAFLGYINSNNVADQLNYTITDGFGGVTTGYVNILVSTNPIFGQTNPQIISTNGGVQVMFCGVPGYTYIVQRNLVDLGNANDWFDFSTNAATTNSPVLIITDTNNPQAFYRLKWQP